MAAHSKHQTLNNNNNQCFTAIIQVNLVAFSAFTLLVGGRKGIKNWRILLVQSFTARMPLFTATSIFGLGRRH